jgi:hypothetical protein
MGVEEYRYDCNNCKLYTEVFEYGSTEIGVGDFTTGYGYTMKYEEQQEIWNKVKKVAELYKNKTK